MSDGIDVRRISLPIFASDSGKDIPNYLRASAGSCHDFCKYGKDTTAVRQIPPWVKISVMEPNAVLSKGVPVVKKVKVVRTKVSDLEICKKKEISLMSAPSLTSREENIKHSEEFPPKSSKEKLVKEKSLTKKSVATSGTSKSEKLNRDNKIVKKCNEGRRHDMVTESPKALRTNPPKKPNAITKPPKSLPPSKLAAKAKTPPSLTTLTSTPTAKARLHSFATVSKAKSFRASSATTSATKMLKTPTVKASTPINPPRNTNIKKSLNIKDQIATKGHTSKVRIPEKVATRSGSISCKSRIATNLKKKELKQVEAQIAETKEIDEKREQQGRHPTEFENKKEMESHEEVPEKTLYIIKMKTVDKTQPPRVEQEILDMQPLPSFSPSTSPSSITASIASSKYEVSQDDSTYTESEEGYFGHENDHLGKGGNLKAADKIKSNAVSLHTDVNDPVKLKFRRGRVVEITQEKNVLRRLTFRKEYVLEQNTTKEGFVRKISFKMTEATQDNATTVSNSGTVVLRHQDVQDKKDAQGLLNNVIEETASRLVETRKSKVKALVGAFETLISLQDGKPATR